MAYLIILKQFQYSQKILLVHKMLKYSALVLYCLIKYASAQADGNPHVSIISLNN